MAKHFLKCIEFLQMIARCKNPGLSKEIYWGDFDNLFAMLEEVQNDWDPSLFFDKN